MNSDTNKSPFPEEKRGESGPSEEEKESKGKKSISYLADDLQGGSGESLDTAEPDESNTWVITYADLMTLLMTFFVLLFSVSQIDAEKFQSIAQSLAAALGSGQVIFIKESSAPTEAPSKQSINTAYYADQLRDELQEEIEQGILEVEHKGNIITINILQNGSFQKGKAVLNTGFLKSLEKIQKALVNIPGTLTVAGHTDDIPIQTERFRSNWELSAARAYSVMHELLKNNILPDERFLLMGHAETKSRVPNTSEVNRIKNRRVEIIIDQREQQLAGEKSSSANLTTLQNDLTPEIKQGSIFLNNQ